MLEDAAACEGLVVRAGVRLGERRLLLVRRLPRCDGGRVDLSFERPSQVWSSVPSPGAGELKDDSLRVEKQAVPSRQRVCQRAVVLSCQQSRRPFGAALRAMAGQDESMQRTFGNDDAAPDAGTSPRQRALREDSRAFRNPGSPARHDDVLRTPRPSPKRSRAGLGGDEVSVARLASPEKRPRNGRAPADNEPSTVSSSSQTPSRGRASSRATATPHAPKKRRGSKQAAKLTPTPRLPAILDQGMTAVDAPRTSTTKRSLAVVDQGDESDADGRSPTKRLRDRTPRERVEPLEGPRSGRKGPRTPPKRKLTRKDSEPTARRTTGKVSRKEARFSASDDEAIVEYAAEHDSDWTGSAAALFPGRDLSDTNVRDRSYIITRNKKSAKQHAALRLDPDSDDLHAVRALEAHLRFAESTAFDKFVRHVCAFCACARFVRRVSTSLFVTGPNSLITQVRRGDVLHGGSIPVETGLAGGRRRR